MAKHTIGIISLGIMGRRMLTYLVTHDSFTVTGVWDPDPAARAITANEFPDVTIKPDADAVIADADLVYIACPPLWHKEYCEKAIAAGKRVYCENPLRIDVAQSRALVAAFEASDTANIVNFAQASSPAVEEIERALKAGEMGTVTNVDITLHFSQWPRDWQADADWLRFADQGGYTREVTSHFLYCTERLLGSAKIVFAKSIYPSEVGLCETNMYAHLDCSGVPVAVTGAVGGTTPDRIELAIYGTKRSYRIQQFYILEKTEGGDWENVFPPLADPRSVSIPRQLYNVANWMNGADHTMPSAKAALSVQELVEGILAK